MSTPITYFVTSTNSLSRFLSRPNVLRRQKLRSRRALRTTPRALASHSINDIAQSVRSRQTSASRLLEDALTRIEETDPHVNAYISVDVEDAQSQAMRIDEEIASGRDPGPLAGVPVSIKDNISTKGQPTTAGSRILDGFVPAYNATVVQRLIDSGAIILGKTNLDEFGMGSSTEASAYAKTLNPWDLSRVPGGSSGGSAAAVAAGMCTAALGSDTGGSIRQPASFCGITGFKPSYGRVSRHGLLAYASSFDTIGPLCRSVEDAALLMQVIAGADGMDSTASNSPVPSFTGCLQEGLSGLRFGVVEESLDSGVDTEVSAAVQSAIEVLKSLGADVQTVSLPLLSPATAAYYVIAHSEASANLARYDGVRYGVRAVDAQNSSDMYALSRAAGFGEEVKRRLMAGTYALSSGYYDAYYLKAQRVRAALTRDMKKFFAEGFDALITPVSATPAFKIGEKIHDPVSMMLGDVFTIPANLTGLPAVSLPCGKTESNLPIGFQVIGTYMKDEVVLKIGHAYQQATSHHEMVPGPIEATVAVSV